MRTVVTKSHGIMTIEEEMRQIARELIDQYPEELGHIDLNRVIFVRSEAIKLKKKNNWLGKCFYFRPETRITNNYAVMKLVEHGLVDADRLIGFEDDIFDIRYMIVLNDVAIDDIGVDKPRMERIVLHHELLHISDDMEGNIQHDIQDFVWIIDRYGPHWTQGIVEVKDKDKDKEDEFADDFVKKMKEAGTKLSMNMPTGSDYGEVE